MAATAPPATSAPDIKATATPSIVIVSVILLLAIASVVVLQVSRAALHTCRVAKFEQER